jgi:hypothetical protein
MGAALFRGEQASPKSDCVAGRGVCAGRDDLVRRLAASVPLPRAHVGQRDEARARLDVDGCRESPALGAPPTPARVGGRCQSSRCGPSSGGPSWLGNRAGQGRAGLRSSRCSRWGSGLLDLPAWQLWGDFRVSRQQRAAPAVSRLCSRRCAALRSRPGHAQGTGWGMAGATCTRRQRLDVVLVDSSPRVAGCRVDTLRRLVVVECHSTGSTTGWSDLTIAVRSSTSHPDITGVSQKVTAASTLRDERLELQVGQAERGGLRDTLGRRT